MALTLGTKLGPYEIMSLVGAGGMGEVYRARDTRLGRDVAIKVLPEALAHDADRLRRFEQEARTIGDSMRDREALPSRTLPDGRQTDFEDRKLRRSWQPDPPSIKADRLRPVGQFQDSQPSDQSPTLHLPQPRFWPTADLPTNRPESLCIVCNAYEL